MPADSAVTTLVPGTGQRAGSRAMITGIGVVTPVGHNAEDYWAAVLRGQSGISRITRFDPSQYSAQLAAQADVDVSARLPTRLLRQTDLVTRRALIAAEEALSDAEASPREMPDYAAGVMTAATAGGFDFVQREMEALRSKGSAYVSAYHGFAWFYPANSGQISIRNGMRGPGGALVADQAGGLDAMARARRYLRDGTALMLTGGIDGSLCPWAWVCLLSSGQVTTAGDPQRAYLPFDAAASGYVPGEGGALLVIEDEAAAREREAGHVYGEVAGYAATFDARPGTGSEPGLRRAIVLALADARVTPGEVDVVFADASGIPELDRAEEEALAGIFGPRGVPVAAPKTMTGRLFAGGGPLDAVTALLAMRDSVIPPAVNVDRLARPELIDLITRAPREARVRCALVLARGYGGFNSALVLKTAAPGNLT